jgi:hypothetical protein
MTICDCVENIKGKSFQEVWRGKAYQRLRSLVNDSNSVPTWSRPFQVIRGERFAKELIKLIRDPRVIPLTHRSILGSIDLISDNTELLMDTAFRLTLKNLYT